MTAPHKILYVLPSLQVGGTEKTLLTLIRNLDKNLFQPELCLTLGEGPLLEDAKSLNIPIHTFNATSSLELATLFAVRKLVSGSNYDLVHSTLIEAELYGRFGAFFSGRIPCVSTITNTYVWQDSSQPKLVIKNWFSKMTMRYLTSCVVSKSMALAEYYQNNLHYMMPKLTIIPNGIPWDAPEWKNIPSREDIRESLGIGADILAVLIVASLRDKKDHRTLLEAWAKLSNGASEKRVLLIAGEGPLEEELRKMANSLGVQDSVRFLGRRNDVPSLWAAADIGVLSSIREGLPNVLIEAGAMGCPVVATKAGGVAEIVREGKTGFIVPPQNPDVLAEMIERLMKDSEERKTMGACAKELIRSEFDSAKVARDHEALYLSILEKK